MRVLTDRGTEYCNNPERREYESCLGVKDIHHSLTKLKNPQTIGIVERLHQTILDEFYRATFRKEDLSLDPGAAGKSGRITAELQ